MLETYPSRATPPTASVHKVECVSTAAPRCGSEQSTSSSFLFFTSPGCCRCRSPSSRASGRKIKKKVIGFSPSSSLTKTQGPCRSQWVSHKPHGNAETPRATSPRCDRVETPLQNKKNCDRHYSQASELQREQVVKGGGGEEAGGPDSAAEDAVQTERSQTQVTAGAKGNSWNLQTST